MTKGLSLLFTCVASVAATAATAQTVADNLKGTWAADSRYCQKSTVIVTEVEPSGIVRGSFTCQRTGWKPVMGDKIEKDAVKGTLTGNRFVMQNFDGGGLDLILEGNALKGYGQARAGAEKSATTYVKQ